MKNTLTNNTVKARYFVVEPNRDKLVEVTSHIGGEDWHCLKLVVSIIGQVQVFIYHPIRPDSPQPQIQMHFTLWLCQCIKFGLWNIIASTYGKADELPYQIQRALSCDSEREEYYFWHPNATAEDEEASQYTPVKKWKNFIWDKKICEDIFTEEGSGHAATHFRLELVLPKPWHKELKCSMLLWTPGGKTPRRYNITPATTGEEIVKKLSNSGFDIPWAIKNHLRWWDDTFLRLWWR